MSARAWETRRLLRRLDIAMRHLRRDPEATIRITKDVVVVSTERYERLIGRWSGCYGGPRGCEHFDDLACLEAEVAAKDLR